MLSQFKGTINCGNFYILLWCIYYIYPSGNLISNSLQLVILVISIINTFITLTKFNLPIYFRGLNLLWGLILCYTIIAIIFEKSYFINSNLIADGISYIKPYCKSLLPVYSFYYYCKKGDITESNIRFWTFIFLIVNFYQYLHYYESKLERSYFETETEITNNGSYYFLQSLPLIFFWNKKPIIQYVLLAVIMLFLILGMKRGAIIIGCICVIHFILQSLQYASIKKKIIIISLCIILIYITTGFIENMINNSDYFNQRINDTLGGSVSGRDSIFSRLTDFLFYKTTLLQLLFGCGINYTIEIVGNYAHNDWLEIAINQGIFGIIIFILYWHCFIKNIFKIKHSKTAYSSIVCYFIIYFTSTFFSMSINSISVASSLALGYILTLSYRKKQLR